jgi:hypothetical protein
MFESVSKCQCSSVEISLLEDFNLQYHQPQLQKNPCCCLHPGSKEHTVQPQEHEVRTLLQLASPASSDGVRFELILTMRGGHSLYKGCKRNFVDVHIIFTVMPI